MKLKILNSLASTALAVLALSTTACASNSIDNQSESVSTVEHNIPKAEDTVADNLESKFHYLNLLKCKTEEDLINMYGKENVGKVQIDDYFGVPFTYLFKGSKDQVTVFFTSIYNDAKRASDKVIQYRFDAENYAADQTRWILPLDIYPGISLEELERENNAPITFDALEMEDVSGHVLDWHGGVLSKIDNGYKYEAYISPSDSDFVYNEYWKTYEKMRDKVLNSEMSIVKNAKLMLGEVKLIVKL